MRGYVKQGNPVLRPGLGVCFEVRYNTLAHNRVGRKGPLPRPSVPTPTTLSLVSHSQAVGYLQYFSMSNLA